MKARMLALLLTVLTLLAPLNGMFALPSRAAEWTTDYRIWSQSDPLWGSRLIGNKTMSSVGCLITAVAKLMVHAGQRDPAEFNPGIALTEMKECNIFHGTNSMYTGMLANDYFSTYAPELTSVYNSGDLSRPMSEAEAAANFRTFIDNDYYIIVMTNTVRNTTHWMTVDDIVDGHVMVMDNREVIDLYDDPDYNGVARYLLVKYSGEYAYPASAGVKKPDMPDPDSLDRTEVYSSPDQLRIRSKPSLSASVIGGLSEGERVRIKDVTVADGYVWGQMDMGGWCAISLCTYVSGSLYYIFYDRTGGTGGPSYQKNPYDQSVTLSADRPAREGYTFLGWSADPDSAVPEYQPGASVNVNADLTLYAVWEKARCETYVTPNLLRVRSGPSLDAPKLTNLAEGTTITVYEAVEADGYTWGRLASGGWCAISICTYVEGALYSIFYDPNGGIGGIVSQDNPTDQSVIVSSDIPTREGYTFLGYAISPDGKPDYQPGDTIDQNADLTLYAIWGEGTDASDKRLSCPEDRYFASYYQTRKNGENPNLTDLRFVIVGNLEKLKAVTSADVSITFYSNGNVVKRVDGILGGAQSTYQLFSTVTAAGDVYTAAEGCAIFGQQISGVPASAFDRITLQITDRSTGNLLLDGSINTGV